MDSTVAEAAAAAAAADAADSGDDEMTNPNMTPMNAENVSNAMAVVPDTRAM